MQDFHAANVGRNAAQPNRSGGRVMISRSEARALGNVEGSELISLMGRAAKVRDEHWGRSISFSRKVFLPLTNMCRNSCKYCAFVQTPASSSARYMTPGEVLREARRGVSAGCKEALFSLGEKPELRYSEARQSLDRLGYATTIDYLEAMCRLVMAETGIVPHVNAGALSDEALFRLRAVSGSMGMMLESVSARLLRRGGAHHACPDKAPTIRLRTLEAAGRQNIPFTTGILIGIGETWDERVDSLISIGEIHQRLGHIQEVIVQNFRAKPDTESADWPEPTLDDMLRTLATARLILPREISLQAPPNLADVPAAYIGAGINDWGGVSPVTVDFINPERPWPMIAKLRAVTESCGYALRERLTVYPRFLRESNRFIAATVTAPLRTLCSDDGYASSIDYV
jgi:7,8-didemethyl-8-hydroxy-5-deazariboflavin synthase CofG subunit